MNAESCDAQAAIHIARWTDCDRLLQFPYMKEFRLCCVNGPFAYFTTKEVAEQATIGPGWKPSLGKKLLFAFSRATAHGRRFKRARIRRIVGQLYSHAILMLLNRLSEAS
jgi:hypothetical protein